MCVCVRVYMYVCVCVCIRMCLCGWEGVTWVSYAADLEDWEGR